MTDKQEQWWWFSFGYGHQPGIGYYAKYYGTAQTARDHMVMDYGDKWAFQYASAEDCGVEKFSLKEVI